MTYTQERMIKSMECIVMGMIQRGTDIDIDVVERVFEDGCARCKTNKGCSGCPAQGRFIAILDMEVVV